jgi:hypothetical protein
MPATITALGGIVLAGLTLTTDPQKYKAPRMPGRGTVLPGIQGTVTIQDFPRVAKGSSFVLQGAGGQGLDQDTVNAIDALKDEAGAIWSYSDWLGNVATVWIEDFDPELNAPWQLYDYTLTLRIVSLTLRRGVAYVGA